MDLMREVVKSGMFLVGFMVKVFDVGRIILKVKM